MWRSTVSGTQQEMEMGSRIRGIAAVMGLVAAVGCAGQQVATDYAPSVAFSQYKTFALVSRPDSAAHQLLDDRVANAVEAQMEAKGLKETDRTAADLYVGYGLVDRTHKEVYTTGTGWGWGGGWGWRAYRWGVAWPADLRSDVYKYTDGTVVIMMVDAKTKRVIWEGQEADAIALPVNNPAKATKSIDEAVTKILAKYPSQSAA
jgi:Domain of unknown function (DUF4136)